MHRLMHLMPLINSEINEIGNAGETEAAIYVPMSGYYQFIKLWTDYFLCPLNARILMGRKYFSLKLCLSKKTI